MCKNNRNGQYDNFCFIKCIQYTHSYTYTHTSISFHIIARRVCVKCNLTYNLLNTHLHIKEKKFDYRRIVNVILNNDNNNNTNNSTKY